MVEWRMRLLHFKEKIRENDLSIYASSMAFFLILSFIPTLLLLFSFFPFMNVTDEELVNIVRKIFPRDLFVFIKKMIEQIYVKSARRASLAGLFSLWSSGKGTMALIQSLNKIHDVKEKRGYFKLRLIASFYTLVLLFVFMGSMYLEIFGNPFYRYLFSLEVSSQFLKFCFMQGKIIVRAMFLLYLCLCLYTFLPSTKVSIKDQIPGAILAVILWIVFSYGFSVYVTKIQRFTAYGTFGGILLFLLWLYFCSFILLLGSLLNREIKLDKLRKVT